MHHQTTPTASTNHTFALQLRYSSQVSLSSASDLMEFRYYNVYTQIGIYKGRLVALKRLRKKNVEITRKVKKELKMVRKAPRVSSFVLSTRSTSPSQSSLSFLHALCARIIALDAGCTSMSNGQMRDLRHDNLNQLIGASIDSPNICILTDYCARGSLRVMMHSDWPCQ